MEEYKNIMKLVDSKLAEQESIIEHYRKKQTEWEETTAYLTSKISTLESTISDLEADNEKFINEIKRTDGIISAQKETIEHLKKQLNDF